MWDALKRAGGPNGLSPSVVKNASVHRGQQGIFRDQQATRSLTPDGTGVTVGVLHTGTSYADDLSSDGVIYHYPATKRGERDANEIAATKRCGELQLPLFVVETPDPGSKVRNVHMGWVAEYDDATGQILILFSNDPPPFRSSDEDEDSDAPFTLRPLRTSGTAVTKTRPNQARFRFAVLRRYGSSCALCGVTDPHLLQAAHLCPVEDGGSDDPRNGLVLCLNHHRAVDVGLIRVNPNSLRVLAANGHELASFRVERSSISHLAHQPETEALEWHWTKHDERK